MLAEILEVIDHHRLSPITTLKPIRFLNDPDNRRRLLGVISAGNTNFGAAYCLAGHIIARKCAVPHLYQFELMGTPDDVEAVREGLISLWQPLCSPTPA